jgi:hypothetical protein
VFTMHVVGAEPDAEPVMRLTYTRKE